MLIMGSSKHRRRLATYQYYLAPMSQNIEQRSIMSLTVTKDLKLRLLKSMQALPDSVAMDNQFRTSSDAIQRSHHSIFDVQLQRETSYLDIHIVPSFSCVSVY
ncbi:hypothetical protein VNO77_27056 [Canavalia gladiata]|uniref:Uncharacterized protein n=1 Tax=Canavalia gladiata TaxID=3824 RepID=A0AAN9KU35_CANGL